MPLHPTPQGLIDQITDLVATDGHIRQPLARQQQLGGEGIAFLPPALPEGGAGFAMVDGAAADGHPLFVAQQLVGR